MKTESRLSYSDKYPYRPYPLFIREAPKRETLTNPECFKPTPKILAFMGASGSGKDTAIEILASLPGRRGVAKKLELSEPVSIRVISKVTDRPPRVEEITKVAVNEAEFTKLKQSGKLIGEYGSTVTDAAMRTWRRISRKRARKNS